MRVLAVTLYVGEAEYDACCASLARQTNVQVTHKVIRDLPTQEAHQALYRAFNENGDDYDFLIKLDADMVFSRDDALETILKSFTPEIDIVAYTVWDRLTQSRIWSFNAYRSTCKFEADQNDALFTDRLPVRHVGRSVSFVDKANLVLHAPAPSDFQAFMFGIHRAFKVVQPNVKVPRIEASYHQMRILRNVWRNCRDNSDSKALFSIFGAEMVLTRQISEKKFNSKEDFRKYFENMSLHTYTPTFIRNYGYRHPLLNVLTILGVKQFTLSSFDYLKRRGLSQARRLLTNRTKTA